MLFEETCPCCTQNKTIFDTQKKRLSASSKRYYEKNREKIIIKTLKRYYLTTRVAQNPNIKI